MPDAPSLSNNCCSGGPSRSACLFPVAQGGQELHGDDPNRETGMTIFRIPAVVRAQHPQAMPVLPLREQSRGQQIGPAPAVRLGLRPWRRAQAADRPVHVFVFQDQPPRFVIAGLERGRSCRICHRLGPQHVHLSKGIDNPSTSPSPASYVRSGQATAIGVTCDRFRQQFGETSPELSHLVHVTVLPSSSPTVSGFSSRASSCRLLGHCLSHPFVLPCGYLED